MEEISGVTVHLYTPELLLQMLRFGKSKASTEVIIEIMVPEQELSTKPASITLLVSNRARLRSRSPASQSLNAVDECHTRMLRTQNVKSLVEADRLLQAFQASSGHLVIVTPQKVQLWQHREGELLRVHQARSHKTLLLILTLYQTSDHLVAAVTGDSRPHDGVWGCLVFWFNTSGVVGGGVAVKVPECQQEKRNVTRETQPCCSNVLAAASNSNLSIGAFSIYRGYVHIYVMDSDVGGTRHALHQDITDFQPAAADPCQESRNDTISWCSSQMQPSP